MSASLPLLGEPPPRAARSGLALSQKGFRPFFLLAAIFAAAILPLWLLVLHGSLAPSPYVPAIYWHAHEMVFGFATAVIAGFLLTAVGNWTGRETLVGAPLLALAAWWLAGRMAFATAAALPRGCVAVIDLSFLPALTFAVAGPLVRSGNRRNFVMVAFLAALFVANVAVHADALGLAPGAARAGCLAGVDLVILLMVLMAGRVFPMFTRNATGDDSIRSIPALDRIAAVSMIAMVLADVFTATRSVHVLVSALAAVATGARAVPWITRRAFRIPLLWILHAGYAWIPLGLSLRSAADLTGAVPPSAATHALTTGAIGALTLGMMARVSLGHTGRPLVAPRSATIAFALVTVAALVRVVAPIFAPGSYRGALDLAGSAWCLAFAFYVAAYARPLVRPRADGKAG